MVAIVRGLCFRFPVLEPFVVLFAAYAYAGSLKPGRTALQVKSVPGSLFDSLQPLT